jgi:hypothetical protein
MQSVVELTPFSPRDVVVLRPSDAQQIEGDGDAGNVGGAVESANLVEVNSSWC